MAAPLHPTTQSFWSRNTLPHVQVSFSWAHMRKILAPLLGLIPRPWEESFPFRCHIETAVWILQTMQGPPSALLQFKRERALPLINAKSTLGNLKRQNRCFHVTTRLAHVLTPLQPIIHSRTLAIRSSGDKLRSFDEIV